MIRSEAIDVLVRHDLSQLGAKERETLLLDWWSIDADDPGYETLPEPLRAVLKRSDSPDELQSHLYEPLLQLALQRSFAGVVNSYLEWRLSVLGFTAKIDGAVEGLLECSCCGFRTLHRRGHYDICVVCFWEDDGTTDPDSPSGPNHMTLREARRNFAEIGAVSDAARHRVLPDGQDRFARGDSLSL